MRRPPSSWSLHRALALVGLALCLATSGIKLGAEPVTIIRDNGNSANRVDYLILGDGYTAADINSGKYANDVEAFITGVFQQEPYKEYQKYFNVRRIDVVSAESGADHPELGTSKNTALDAAYNCNGIQRLICVNTTKVNAVIAASGIATNAKDIILVMVNDPIYGGSGGSIAVASTHSSAVELILHETGHSFGLLADEYGGPPPPSCSAGSEPSQVNATKDSNRATIKWGVWISPSTPMPTSAPSDNVPGAYAGAAYCDTELFRPTYNSKMRSLDRPFETINIEQHIRRIYNFVPPIDGYSPAASTLTFDLSAPQTFTVSVPQPFTHGLSVTWKVDGVTAGTSLSFGGGSMAIGVHSLVATVTDPTGMVRVSYASTLTATRTWTVTVTGTPVAPAITTQPVNQSVLTGGNVTFTVNASGSPLPTYQWQVSTNGGSTYSALPNGAPYSGVTTKTLSVNPVTSAIHNARYRAVATNASGSATSTGAILTVTGVSLTPAALKFVATKAGENGAILSVTPPQQVTVSFGGAVSAWTATADQPWLQITPGAGAGAGTFSVAVVNPGNVIGGQFYLWATITLNAPGAPNAPLSLIVNLQVDQTGNSTVPAFGQVDTPAQSATGIVGAIGVTGWVIDDVGVSSVKIYRGCLGFDVQASCQMVAGNNVVFVGDAAFVPGARPDVEASYPGYPAGNVAGWGYLLLTNMLPNVTGALGYGGQGAITLYAIATDVEGHKTLLGRTQSDHTATSITMANTGLAKPFGAIDTPSQGGVVSGTFPNFGWVLTPDLNSIADGTDILMPLNGSTITLYIDGVAKGTVTYNQCRGNVGNPVPGGLYCNDDVSSIFGNLTPQPTFSTRTSNPTPYRNLDAGRSAIGSFDINTTTLTNGMHSIAWGVTDSAARGEGIGSRNFFVLNVGAGTVLMGQTLDEASGVARGRASDDRLELMLAGVQSRGDVASLPDRPATANVLARTGFSLRTRFADIAADTDGVRRIEMPDLGRVELRVGGAVTAGYLVVGDALRDLPVGSHLDAKTGTFTWAPVPGYLGTYHLVFVVNGERLLIDVTIRPGRAMPAGEIRIQ